MWEVFPVLLEELQHLLRERVILAVLGVVNRHLARHLLVIAPLLLKISNHADEWLHRGQRIHLLGGEVRCRIRWIEQLYGIQYLTLSTRALSTIHSNSKKEPHY